MTEVGTVIAGKYEILKEVGHGGMSVVYLAMDTHLNRNWAVKEIRKTGKTKNDEIIENSILVEANLIKRLDHPALPRIVDIIDNGSTIYIVMDFIEGESMDKILAEYGAQPEEKVIEWAMQVCDVFSYLHSQKPPIIYRDMKPANLMLKPNGNICIIDFGIAREYKEENLADTKVLGTKGYAPPEQYNGQTDPRSDIYALGMTMHQLLTGVDPTSGEQYASVRYWNPELSEGIEAIINKCVEPAAENRYQNCQDLLLDLQDPEKVTRGWKRMLKKRLFTFVGVTAFAILSLIAGIVLNATSKQIKNKSYETLTTSANVEDNYVAIELDPERTKAYQNLVDYYTQQATDVDTARIDYLINQVDNSVKSGYLNSDNGDVANLYYGLGKLKFYKADAKSESPLNGVKDAKEYFRKAAQSTEDFDNKVLAEVYYDMSKILTANPSGMVTVNNDYIGLFQTIENTLARIADRKIENFDKISFYYIGLLFIESNAEDIADSGISKETVVSLMNILRQQAEQVTPNPRDYVVKKQESIEKHFEKWINEIDIAYSIVSNKGGI